MKIKKTSFIALAAILLIALAVYVLLPVNKLTTVPKEQSDGSSSKAASNTEATAINQPTNIPIEADANDTKPQAYNESKSSLSDKVRALEGANSPKSTFNAYKILYACYQLKKRKQEYELTKSAERDNEGSKDLQPDMFPEALDKKCGDLSDKDISRRLALVETAAMAGIPMAAILFIEEGPWGDVSAIYSRPQDPLITEWRGKAKKYLELAAKNGDTAALTSLINQYSTGVGIIGEFDAALAYQYAIARNIVYEKRNGRKIQGQEIELEKISSKISLSAASSAKAAGEQIAENILKRGG